MRSQETDCALELLNPETTRCDWYFAGHQSVNDVQIQYTMWAQGRSRYPVRALVVILEVV